MEPDEGEFGFCHFTTAKFRGSGPTLGPGDKARTILEVIENACPFPVWFRPGLRRQVGV